MADLERSAEKMEKLKIVCIALGLLHAAVMTVFALGPELSPLRVMIVDAPVAHFTKDLASPFLALGIPILACSVLYPGLVYLAGLMILRLMKKPQSMPAS